MKQLLHLQYEDWNPIYSSTYFDYRVRDRVNPNPNPNSDRRKHTRFPSSDVSPCLVLGLKDSLRTFFKFLSWSLRQSPWTSPLCETTQFRQRPITSPVTLVVRTCAHICHCFIQYIVSHRPGPVASNPQLSLEMNNPIFVLPELRTVSTSP